MKNAENSVIVFQASPEGYKHWGLEIAGPVARLSMDVQEDETLTEGYKLKLNSYDLGVDIELADAIQRIRFEHPEVRAVVITSLKPRIFCAGANIYMLGTSSHAFKVNFCKFTNETRCAIEDDSRHSGRRYIAALNGTASGGGYELAIACDEIYLVDDGNSAVSLPEVPLLGVLPGTGGLTRLVDKRKVRRDRADVFSTLAEGLKGKRAKEWGLIDGYFPTSKFQQSIHERVREIVEAESQPAPAGVKLTPLQFESTDDSRNYKYVKLKLHREQRYADLTVHGPQGPQPSTTEEIQELGDAYWPLQAYRELDDVLLHLRVNEPLIGLVCVRTEGNIDDVLAVDQTLAANRDHWLVREIVLHMARVVRRMDLTAKSFFAIVEPGSCFAGNLLELLLASDRSYMLSDSDASLAISELNAGAFPMSNGLTRLQSRFLAEPDKVEEVLQKKTFDTEEADDVGLVTFAPDDLDWEDEIRVAIEERTSLSPDALTGMEASLRFAGPETTDTKIYGRLTAWQNWIFQRPNAVGEKGALTNYGKPTQAEFDYKRT
ncbi:MAG TPA: 2,3-epoxybenzoyl-CoA dihydrolase [Pyrinomonadaceae bacterium]|nr:2,3-epoxybenzoyl-CoA dihydrolase [Pyrinomonadaceae bacterium]